MNYSTSDHDFETELEAQVQAELNLAQSSHPEEATGLPASEWLVDPTDTERYEVGLHSLLSAVEELEGRSRPGQRSADGNRWAGPGT
jgi:hypothetical protein